MKPSHLLAFFLTSCVHAPSTQAQPKPLSREEVRREVAQVRKTMEEAYAGKVFRTKDSWASFLRELEQIATQERTPASLCDALGDALWRLNDPDLLAVPEVGSPCHKKTPGMRVFSAAPAGGNIAHQSAQAWGLVRTESPDIVILGIQRFDPPGPSWRGFEAAAARLSAASAIVIDLRHAAGDDPRAALPLVRALSGLSALMPLREVVVPEGPVAEELRQAGRSLFSWRSRDPEVWRTLVGSEPVLPGEDPKNLPMIRLRGPDDPPLLVIVGGSCGPACELIARMLLTYAGARLQGQVGSDHRLAMDDRGILQLEPSKVRVYIPTAAYVLNPRIDRAGGLPGRWYQAEDAPAAPIGELESALAGLREQLRWRAEERRWLKEAPPPCASFPAVARRDQLPAEAQERIGSGSLPPFPHHISATLHLAPEAAQKYVAGCPGLSSFGAYASGDTGRSSTVEIRTSSFEALTRLAQSPAVVSIGIEPEYEMEPNSQ